MTGSARVFYVTFRENAYAASTVTVETGQPVISSGPYAAVRRPMHTSGIILFAETPVALASWWGLAPAAMLAAVIVWRLIDGRSASLRTANDPAREP